MTQVKSSRAESSSSRVDWIGLARRRRLAWAKARFAGGLEMKLQSRADCGLLVLQSQLLRRRCIWQEALCVPRVSVHPQAPSACTYSTYRT